MSPQPPIVTNIKFINQARTRPAPVQRPPGLGFDSTDRNRNEIQIYTALRALVGDTTAPPVPWRRSGSSYHLTVNHVGLLVCRRPGHERGAWQWWDPRTEEWYPREGANQESNVSAIRKTPSRFSPSHAAPDQYAESESTTSTPAATNANQPEETNAQSADEDEVVASTDSQANLRDEVVQRLEHEAPRTEVYYARKKRRNRRRREIQAEKKKRKASRPPTLSPTDIVKPQDVISASALSNDYGQGDRKSQDVGEISQAPWEDREVLYDPDDVTQIYMQAQDKHLQDSEALHSRNDASLPQPKHAETPVSDTSAMSYVDDEWSAIESEEAVDESGSGLVRSTRARRRLSRTSSDHLDSLPMPALRHVVSPTKSVVRRVVRLPSRRVTGRPVARRVRAVTGSRVVLQGR